MHLKTLDLIGFKSFSDPTKVTLQSGISVIVGPNGCGKSNIVDAILWVLGEQSTKTLRSDRMEDVIFNGSASRKPIGMAEVTLTVAGVTSEEVLNRWGEFQELSICRRLFRSGESEYLINRIPCRLKDVREVLIDTGAGHKGHTIIEQGKVDQLLNSSANERRGLIEDTAGIGKYKLRKAEAERKLNATHQNLLRVRDIIQEVKRQIQTLDRQVRKTEAYNKIRDEAHRLEQWLLLDNYRQFKDDSHVIGRQVGEAQNTEAGLLAQASSFQAKVEESKTALVQEERILNESRQKAFELKTQVHRQESRIELLRSQTVSWADQRSHFIQEQEHLEESRTKAENELVEIDRKRQELQQSLGRLKERFEAQSRSNQDLESRVTERQAGLEKHKTRLFEILGQLTEEKNQAAGLESRNQEIFRIQEKSRAEIAGITGRVNQNQATLEDERAVLVRQEKEVSQAQEDQVLLLQSIQKKQKEAEDLNRSVLHIREELTHSEALLASIKERENSMLAAQLGLQDQLKEETELLNRFVGIVADGFTVTAEYEMAIEAVLGDRLNALIAEDHTAIYRAIEHLKRAGAVRGVFIPKTIRMKAGIPNLKLRDGVIGSAASCVISKPGMENLVQAILGGVILVRDLATALEIWKEQPLSEILVTLDGEIVFPSGMVSGGHPSENGHGLLQTRRRLVELEQDCRSLRDQLAKTEGEKNSQSGELENLTREYENLIQKQHEVELERTAQREKLSAMQGELDRILENRSLLELEDQQRSQELQEIKNRMDEVRGRIAELEAQHGQIQMEIGKSQEDLKGWDDELKSLSSELTQVQVNLTSMNEREEVLIREEQRHKQDLAGFAERYQERQTEIESLVLKTQAAQRDLQEAEAEIVSLTEVLTETENSVSEKSGYYAEQLNHLKELEEKLSSLRGESGRIEHQLKDLQIREAELKLKLEHIREQLSASHSTTPEDAMPNFEQESVNREEAGPKLTELRVKIDQMGPVNLAAPEEYKELDERYQFLSSQEGDLTRSAEDVQKAIQKINRTAKELFLSTYQGLRVKFQEVFGNFFEGGQADLILADENNPLESDIEILAQPPGKRLRHISLLSGGEKALTAISLLFASFLIHPTPFCVLDEIDAPLDEENTRRFLRTLRQMTDHSQFIVITHNKRTMEQADILYGVTMEEPGVSKLVSVNFESAGNGNGDNKHPPKSTAAVSPSATA